ncbi:MAG: hypothetical protein FJX56_00135 [Alphaproteobacteria bacterium]|nr:hypothetical protein [Alphaproteobacteria bacterium]
MQGSRRGDALVLWALLQVVGSRRLGEDIAAGIDLARRFHTLLDRSARCEPLHRPDLNLQAFRHGDPDHTGDRVRSIQRGLADLGRTWVSISSWRGETVYRTVLNNPPTSVDHLDDLVATLDRLDP